MDRLSVTSVLVILLVAMSSTTAIQMPRNAEDFESMERLKQFWSASCSARGVNINTPTASAVLFYMSLIAVGVAMICYAYRMCLRMVSSELRRMPH
ncbi:envelope glycoprotein N [Felid alphaherpesvirus 1]|uniref:Envelope glycoprotein N n=1 Tax=Feline herpesvirus 1 TaxID=10334 RepID=D1FXT2_FHV1|nr:envelope glycoprotein N [Felid alphaherpesvirus 1]AMN88940.1 envelope glycoprotein N [synthetic construct]ACT88308.1 envelope glycoprotein N [Felid alphaherpesvirus 1]ALJ84129.1 envelope glycoprotein N [Felid alphaherpesvirus 1]ALJ84205.1 envelope glycoprotein N [Felid alphaherpesvirus 1]ALJ84281.1 envelope glycoprotein N [Felid alphaherpesvirus 1]